MRIQKLFATLLIGASLLSFSACSEDTPAPPPPEDDPFVVLQDTVADLYNEGVKKITNAASYTMTGSYVSAAEVLSSAELTSNLTKVEMTVANGTFFVDSMASNIDPHTTYFDGTRYYFSDKTDKYFTTTNDRNDFTAVEYLPLIHSEIIKDPQLTENPDGSKLISFRIPFNIYQSSGIGGLFGITFDENYAAADIRVTIMLDAGGYITEFLLSFDNMTDFSDESISQNISASMMLTNYNQAEVVIPADLAEYEDWTEDVGTEPTEPIGELTPEDLN